MFIKDLYQKNNPVLSFEVFPPKKDSDFETIRNALREMAQLRPDYISVTYGAGGSQQTTERSKEVARQVENDCRIPALFHLTCVGAQRDAVHQLLRDLSAQNTRNILALRGDLPADAGDNALGDYRFAYELIEDIKKHHDFCVGAACYPEGHIDCANIPENLDHLRRKQDAGADFLVSQLFFENRYFFRFLNEARKAGITLPISAGIMPILSRKQIERMIFMCGVSLPGRIVKLLHRWGDNPADLRSAGIDYALEQAQNLLENGVDGVHLYTMNHPDIAQAAMRRFRTEQTVSHA